MKKIYMKLAASAFSIVISLTMVVGATFAWMVLSQSPVVNGISMSIGGGRTIMLAPDLTQAVTDENGNEIIVHYPGKFESILNFSDYETYDYLKELDGLSPVSTADGLYWILPSYDETTGLLRPYDQFLVDGTLDYANMTENVNGNYVYLDFWVVSPGAEYDLHIATDVKKNIGSYLIELPGVEEAEDGTLQLAKTEGLVEAVARVGFLVNTDNVGTEAMNAYTESEQFDDRYSSLLGNYQKKGEKVTGDYQFTIYEPNGTKHPSDDLPDGDYIITKPLRYNPYGNSIAEENIENIVTVQDANNWKTLNDGSQFEQIFKAAIANKGKLTPEKAAAVFYQEYLQGQVGAYVNSGKFFQRTDALYGAAEDGLVNTKNHSLAKAGATDDVIITTLQPNTPQKIRMYIWLEGQDADCVNNGSITISGFCLNLELSGADK